MFKKILLSISLIIFFILPAGEVWSLSIFPLRQTISIDPGGSAQVELLVKNGGSETLELKPEVDGFTIDGETGRAIFGVDEEALGWLKPLDENLVLEAGEDSNFSFLVEVPEGAEPGTHYLGLFAKTVPGDGQIGVGGRVGSLLFLHVAGVIKEELVRQSFEVDKNFYFNKKPNLSLELENIGTTHVVPEGRIIVKNIFGSVVDDIPINPDKRKVVPHTNWENNYLLDSPDWKNMGPVKVQLVLNYGLTNQIITDSTSFWYTPTWVLISSFLGIIFIVVLWWILRRM